MKLLPGPYKTRGSSRRKQEAAEEVAQQQRTNSARNERSTERREATEGSRGGLPLGDYVGEDLRRRLAKERDS